jgi:hypothetical protein
VPVGLGEVEARAIGVLGVADGDGAAGDGDLDAGARLLQNLGQLVYVLQHVALVCQADKEFSGFFVVQRDRCESIEH